MIRFGEPTYLYLLFLVPLLTIFFIWGWKRKQRIIQTFAETDLGARLADKVSRRRQKIKIVLLLAIVTLLILTLARPQYGYRWEEVKRRGVDIMIAVDLSKSMLAGDISPDRLIRAKRKIIDLLKIVKGDRIGLIGFAGRAFVLTPLTLDNGAIRLFADQLEPDIIPVPGTAVAEAIELAIKALQKGNPESKGLILMSDGEDMAGAISSAAENARENGVKIYTLGIGTTEGAPIPLPVGGFQKDKGEVVLTKLDEKNLIEIAKITGGKYVRSVSSDRDLEEIYKNIQGDLEEHELKENKRKIYIDRFQWFLALALILLIIETFMRETKRQKRKWFRKRWFAGIVIILILLTSSGALAFGITGTIRKGEKLYNEGKYEEALQKFLEAQVERPKEMRLKYNIANTYYRLERYDEAERLFSSIPEEKMRELKERSLYNKGNSEFRMDELEKAIKSYEDALTIDTNDEDAKYNLELVKKLLEQQKQQQQDQKNQQDQEKEQKEKEKEKKEESQGQKDDKKDKQKEGDQKQQEDEKKKDEEKKENGEQDKKQEQPKQEQQQQQSMSKGKMSKEEAARWLSTVKEGKRKKFPKGMMSSGTHDSRKDW